MQIKNHVLLNVTESDIKDGQCVIPEGVTTIGDCAFDRRTSLSSIVIPKSVTTIGDCAFNDCTRLSSIVIPEGVTTIGEFAFDNCTSLSSIVIPKSMTAIGSYAFDNCTSLSSIVIPKSVTTIGACVFNRCTSLSSIVIPEGVTTIGNYAFSDCISLSSIAIPKSVTTIGSHAFNYCTSLSMIHINADTTEEYMRILKLFPEELQQTIQASNIQTLVKKAVLLLADSHQTQGFFDKNRVPPELTAQILAKLMNKYKVEYNIPSFMITKTLEDLRATKDGIPEEEVSASQLKK